MDATDKPHAVLSPADVENMARKIGLSIPALCELAQIAPSTFYRWRAGEQDIGTSIYKRLVDILNGHPTSWRGACTDCPESDRCESLRACVLRHAA